MIGNSTVPATLPRGGIVSIFRIEDDFDFEPASTGPPEQPIPYEGNIYLGHDITMTLLQDKSKRPDSLCNILRILVQIPDNPRISGMKEILVCRSTLLIKMN